MISIRLILSYQELARCTALHCTITNTVILTIIVD